MPNSQQPSLYSLTSGGGGKRQGLTLELRSIADLETQDRQAKADQHALVQLHGGRDAVVERGGFGATPAPGAKPKFA